ncbi:hypothetical protein HX004_11070 [Myroides sp. 1354]|uniref:hypothetical protein n=1 Tax=unclassified Myroides TaxID=2642485 RepID=UPI0025766C4D|nr:MULTISPECIES: hypothetical protein [unclassified Myroides]MDM1044437.1 hypothetical protein [Myroides sp. R163-1]MDM1056311.1 hypothetical protein [Myroides sp. 1354]MDM1069333.1 hypothetical protein [Myroides sp. 1372]
MINILRIYKKNLFLWMLISLLGALLLTKDIPIFWREGLIYFIVFTPLFFMFYNFIVRSKRFDLNIFIFSLLLKVLFIVIVATYLEYIHFMPFLSYNDDYNYEWISSEIVQRWKAEGIGFYNDILFSKGFYSGYPNASALAKYVLGDSFYVPRIMNAIFSSFTVVIFYKTLLFFSSEKLAKSISYIFCISSLFIFYASFQLKDTLLLFFVSCLIYCIGRILFQSFGIKTMFYIVVCSICLMFFRAATLFPIYLSLALVFIVIRDKSFNLFSNTKFLISLLLLLVTFIFSWEYLFLKDILPFDAFSYYDARTNYEGKEDRMSGSNSISKLGALALFLGPIYIILSLFLPTPVFVDIYSGRGELNYSFIPLIDYYAILPIGIVAVIYVVKKLRKNKFFMFLIFFMLLYKLGQASSMSIFDSRQSLPVIYVFFILLGLIERPDFYSYYRKYYKIIFWILLVVMIGFSFVRIYIRSSI